MWASRSWRCTRAARSPAAMTRAGSSPHSKRFSLSDDDVEGDIPLASVDAIDLLEGVGQPDEHRSDATRVAAEIERGVVIAGAVAEPSAVVIEGHERHEHDVETPGRDTACRRKRLVDAESTGDEGVIATPSGEGHGAWRLSGWEVHATTRLPGPLHDRIAVDLAAYRPVGRDACGADKLGQIDDTTRDGNTRTQDSSGGQPTTGVEERSEEGSEGKQ